MERVGKRLWWMGKDGFGTPAPIVSVHEYSNEEQENLLSSQENPNASFIHCFSSPDSLKHLYEEFTPRDDDIYICTYAKSGTTWMQQILFQLLFGPSEDFQDIADESPWIETRLGAATLKENTRYPRIIKTHLRFEHLPSVIKEHGRFFFIDRELRDVFSSYKRHLTGFGLDVSEDNLVKTFISGNLSLGPYAEYINSWSKIAPTVLNDRLKTFHFEDMKKDLPNTIREIIDHLGICVSDEDFKTILYYSSIEYMKMNVHKFNHTAERKLALDLRKKNSSELLHKSNDTFSFIGEGKIGNFKNSLAESTIALIEDYKQLNSL